MENLDLNYSYESRGCGSCGGGSRPRPASPSRPRPAAPRPIRPGK